MTTITPAVASANRLNASILKINQQAFAGALGESFAKINQQAFAGALGESFAKINRLPLNAFPDTEFLGHYPDDVSSSSNVGDRLSQRIAGREVAVMLTVAAFLVVYISFSLLIKHNPQVAKLAAIDGPTPFEAAMAVGALVFWFWMNHPGRPRD